MNGLPCQPGENGFVFSPAEVNRAIDRDNRLKAARLAAIARPKPSGAQVPMARAA